MRDCDRRRMAFLFSPSHQDKQHSTAPAPAPAPASRLTHPSRQRTDRVLDHPPSRQATSSSTTSFLFPLCSSPWLLLPDLLPVLSVRKVHCCRYYYFYCHHIIVRPLFARCTSSPIESSLRPHHLLLSHSHEIFEPILPECA